MPRAGLIVVWRAAMARISRLDAGSRPLTIMAPRPAAPARAITASQSAAKRSWVRWVWTSTYGADISDWAPGPRRHRIRGSSHGDITAKDREGSRNAEERARAG